jgi:hypothetical protein
MKLAELHSNAVDFQKSGIPVTFPELPRRLFPYLPDYQSKEVKLDDQTRYYESQKILGKLYRRIKIRAVPSVKSDDKPVPWDEHPIQHLLSKLKPDTIIEEERSEKDHVEWIFNGYVRELKGIRGIYSTGHIPLSEEGQSTGHIYISKPDFCFQLRGLHERRTRATFWKAPRRRGAEAPRGLRSTC